MSISLEPTGVIDIGSFQTKFIIFAIKNSEVEILSKSILNTEGIKKGIITDLERLGKIITEVIGKAEDEANIQIKNIYLSPNPKNIFSTNFTYSKNIGGYEIEKEKDVQFLINAGINLFRGLNSDTNIIHLFNLNLRIDKNNLIENPIGLVADSLEGDLHIIFCKKNFYINYQKAITKTYLKLEKIIYSPYVLGLAGFVESPLSDSIMVIDFGHETTSVSIFKNGNFLFATSIPIGSWHVTNDISKALNLNIRIADNLKINNSFCGLLSENLYPNYLESENLGIKSYKKVSNNILNKIVTSRLEEIFDFLNKELSYFKINEKIFNKILITGEGSKIKGFEDLLKKKLCINSLSIEKFDLKLKKGMEDNYDVCLSIINYLKNSYNKEIPGFLKTKKNFFEKFYSLFS